MVHKILPDPPEKKPKLAKRFSKSLSKTFSEGRWGLTLNLKSKEVFVGVHITRVIIEPHRYQKKPKVKPGSAIFIPTP